MKVGEKIKYLRKKRGLSVEDLAKMVGKNKATLYRYENGDIENLPYTVIEPIAQALGVLPTYFFDVKNDIKVDTAIKSPEFQKYLSIWIDIVNCVDFTDDEFKELCDYAKYLISKRSDKNE